MTPRLAREAFGGAGWRGMVALRHRVLRAPLGLDFSAAQLEAEAAQIHVALWLDDELAGTLLLLPPDPHGQARLRQMAVAPELRGRGYGKLLVRHGEAELGRLGTVEAMLHARETAVGFYAELGYVSEGDPFLEVTLTHRLMRKRLDQD